LKTLAEYTSAALMVPELGAKTADLAISELCELLQREGCLSDSKPFYDAVMKRERLGSTVMARGWALPHARLEGLPQLRFALGRSSHPLLWAGADGSGVQLVFLFAIPESEAMAYLNVIAAIARLNQIPTLIDQLLRARDRQTMLTIFKQVPVVVGALAGTASRSARKDF